MKTLFALTLAGACSTVCAQTPANNPMPDGSRDMYVGLGVVSSSKYEGAKAMRKFLAPVLQAQFSNGVFIAGMQAGWHLSSQPTLEYGLLLGVQARRTASGVGSGVLDTLTSSSSTSVNLDVIANPGAPPITVLPPGETVVPPDSKNNDPIYYRPPQRSNRLIGMNTIGARVLGGGFMNYYVTPDVRLTSALLYGAGRERDGMILQLDVQRVALELAPHHKLSFGAGVQIVNRNYSNTFFGVSKSESVLSYNPVYQASGGIKDVHANVRWHWALSPSWMLVSSAQVARLQGSAKRSPLVEQPNTYTVSAALAYRF